MSIARADPVKKKFANNLVHNDSDYCFNYVKRLSNLSIVLLVECEVMDVWQTW